MLIPLRHNGYSRAGIRLYHLDLGADAPDTSRQDAVAERIQGLSEEQFNWIKQLYEADAPNREAAAATAREVSGENLNQMRLQNQLTNDYAGYQKDTFRPLERGLVAEAQSYDTTARRDQKAGEAIADVQQQIDASQGQQQRSLTRMGVNPNDGKFAAMSNGITLAGALGKAQAANKAREGVELQGYARKMDAANLGRGLASSQATSAGVALNQGSGAMSAALQPSAITQQGAGMVQQAAGQATQGLGQAGNIFTNSSNLQAQAESNSGLWGALGSIGGGLAANPKLFGGSDKHEKTDRKKVEPEMSLSAIRKLPASESWRYREGGKYDDGGKTHVGPMAQDVQMTLGNGVAPRGKAIDLISMNGHLTNAVKALDKKVITLENQQRKGKS